MNSILRIAGLGLALVSFYCVAEINKAYVIVNNNYKGEIALDFIVGEYPCLTAPLLREWGMHYNDVAKMLFTSKGCVLPRSLRQAEIQTFYDRDATLLTLVIPTELISNMENAVATSRWDEGINAAFVDYQLNYAHYAGERYRDAERHDSLYANFTSGINVDAWRLRYQPIYQRDTWGQPEWYSERVTASRNIKTWRSQLVAGDQSTPAELFDSVRFRGVSLVSDDRMLPDGLRPFSPLIRGYARSNAEVRVRQNGVVIYQTFVPPGAFVLQDIHPSDSEGNIELTIKESDGTETERTIPYSMMPNLVMGNHWKYDLNVGRYKPYHGVEQDKPLFGQYSISYGLPFKTTLYGGSVMAEQLYRSGSLGIGKSLDKWGALSVDYNFSVAQDSRRTDADRGGMWRVRYLRSLLSWESSLSLLAQYYPKQRYRTFSDAIGQQDSYWWDWEDDIFVGEFEAEKKHRLEARYNQYLSDSDSLYLTLVQEAVRGQEKRETSIEIGYSGTWADIDTSIYAEYNRQSYGQEQSLVGISFTIPLSKISIPRLKLNYDHTIAKNGSDSRRLGVSGTALEDYSLSYDLGATQNQKDGSSQDASLDYQYNAGDARLGYSRGKGYRQQNVELSGSAVLHRGGLTLGQSLGETIAIVEVPKSPDIGVNNQYGVTTDWRGYAVVGSLTPYRVNRLSLDTFDLAEGLELPVSEKEVVPTAGAIMFSRFAPARKVSPVAAQTSSPE